MKEYDKPDFTLWNFHDHFTLEWQKDGTQATQTTTTSTQQTTTTSTQQTTNTTQEKTENNDNNSSNNNSDNQKTILISGRIDGTFFFSVFLIVTLRKFIFSGDKKIFTPYVDLHESNLRDLIQFLKFDRPEYGITFSYLSIAIRLSIFYHCSIYENFVMLLYFSCICMSIEDQPFNELPALPSARTRRFLMKYDLLL